MSCGGSHLEEFPIDAKNRNFVNGHSRSIPSEFTVRWFNDFREKFKYFYIGSYIRTMSCYGGHLGFPIDKKNPNFLEGHHWNIPTTQLVLKKIY